MTQKRGIQQGLVEVSPSLPKRSKTEENVIPDRTVPHPEEKEMVQDDDYTSSSGTSSSRTPSSHYDDDDDDEEEADNEGEDRSETMQNSNESSITYVPGRPKPRIERIQPPCLGDGSGLMSRISAFLPQLQAANADLERRLANGGNLQDMIMDQVNGEDEEQYIEMNLGLGVLKEKKKNAEGPSDGITATASSSDSDEEEEDEDEDEDEDGHLQDTEESESNVFNQLMGLGNRSRKQRTKSGIQEVDDG